MPWTVLDALPTWNVTDQDLVARASYALLENGDADATGTTFVFGQFTVQEFLDNANLIQERLFKDSAPVVVRATQGSTPGQSRYTLPNDWIFTRRITWQAQAGGKALGLASTDAFALDNQMTDWEQNTDTPSVYNDGSNLPTLTIEILKAPVAVGTMGLMYVPQPATLTGAGVKLTVPDELESAVFYGTLGEMLSSEGEGFDPERADYCEKRYSLAAELANALITGAQING